MALANRITPPGKKPSVIIQKYCRDVTVNGKIGPLRTNFSNLDIFAVDDI